MKPTLSFLSYYVYLELFTYFDKGGKGRNKLHTNDPLKYFGGFLVPRDYHSGKDTSLTPLESPWDCACTYVLSDTLMHKPAPAWVPLPSSLEPFSQNSEPTLDIQKPAVTSLV